MQTNARRLISTAGRDAMACCPPCPIVRWMTTLSYRDLPALEGASTPPLARTLLLCATADRSGTGESSSDAERAAGGRRAI
jgi:hypothetical protein